MNLNILSLVFGMLVTLPSFAQTTNVPAPSPDGAGEEESSLSMETFLLGRNKGHFTYCLDKALLWSSEIQSNFGTFSFEIGENGKTSKVRRKSRHEESSDIKSFGDCVEDLLKSTQFPCRFRGPYTLVYNTNERAPNSISFLIAD